MELPNNKNYLVVTKANKSGLVDKTGKLVIDAKYAVVFTAAGGHKACILKKVK